VPKVVDYLRYHDILLVADIFDFNGGYGGHCVRSRHNALESRRQRSKNYFANRLATLIPFNDDIIAFVNHLRTFWPLKEPVRGHYLAYVTILTNQSEAENQRANAYEKEASHLPLQL